jgi:hypothetical protein
MLLHIASRWIVEAVRLFHSSEIAPSGGGARSRLRSSDAFKRLVALHSDELQVAINASTEMRMKSDRFARGLKPHLGSRTLNEVMTKAGARSS